MKIKERIILTLQRFSDIAAIFQMQDMLKSAVTCMHDFKNIK